MKKKSQKGFTLVELLLAMAISLVVMSAIFKTFKSQQDTYMIQEQVSVMQQNLRGAMYILTRDLKLAGYYTNFDRNTRTLNWDDRGGTEAIRPLIYAGDNVSATGIKPDTDTITIVKSGNENRRLKPGESATRGAPGTATIYLSDWVDDGGVPRDARDLDGDGNKDLNDDTKRFGLLVQSDLRAADFFEIPEGSVGLDIVPPGGLVHSYTTGDLICRVDVILYKVDDQNPAGPNLVRANLGDSSGAITIAENIDNLQFRYQLNGGAWTDDPAGNEARIRAVRVFMLARSAHGHRGYSDTHSYDLANYPGPNPPNDPHRRKLLCSTVKTRNIGLTE
jgi:prepilin-type N-terminal cleavage/methylation domain-containing protein